MPNKPVVLRFPSELIDAIEARAKARGQSLTDVVLEVLTESYAQSHAFPQPDLVEQVEQLQKYLSSLERQREIILSDLRLREFRLTDSERQSVSSHSSRAQRFEAATQN